MRRPRVIEGIINVRHRGTELQPVDGTGKFTRRNDEIVTDFVFAHSLTLILGRKKIAALIACKSATNTSPVLSFGQTKIYGQ